jgi:hypothetical protein
MWQTHLTELRMRPSTVEPLWRLRVSEKHLHHFVGEATWRYNRREASDVIARLRVNELIE